MRALRCGLCLLLSVGVCMAQVHGNDVSFVCSGQQIGPEGGTDVALGDIDRDGDLDILLTYRFGPIRLFLDDGEAEFKESNQTLPSGEFWGVRTAGPPTLIPFRALRHPAAGTTRKGGLLAGYDCSDLARSANLRRRHRAELGCGRAHGDPSRYRYT